MNITRANIARAGALCWIGSAVFFVGQAIAQFGVRTRYSMIDNYVSDLGAVGCGQVVLGNYRADACSPLHAFMNAGFVLTGAAIVLGAVLLRRLWSAGRARTAGTVLLVLGGVGKIVAGLCPEDLRPIGHFLGGVLSGPVATIGLLVLARSLRAQYRNLSRVMTVCGLVGVLGLLLTAAASLGSAVGVGGAERVAAYPTIIAAVTVGTMLMIKADRASSGTRPSVPVGQNRGAR